MKKTICFSLNLIDSNCFNLNKLISFLFSVATDLEDYRMKQINQRNERKKKLEVSCMFFEISISMSNHQYLKSRYFGRYLI